MKTQKKNKKVKSTPKKLAKIPFKDIAALI